QLEGFFHDFLFLLLLLLFLVENLRKGTYFFLRLSFKTFLRVSPPGLKEQVDRYVDWENNFGREQCHHERRILNLASAVFFYGHVELQVTNRNEFPVGAFVRWSSPVITTVPGQTFAERFIYLEPPYGKGVGDYDKKDKEEKELEAQPEGHHVGL
ncbi:hypothetical protein K435DRAFT_814222, partial [Dendrothele bispora CBS 962.96]